MHQRWANITASVIQTGCTVATLGATVASAGSATLAGVIAGTATIGSIPVVAAAIPANKGLNIAGKIIGMAEMAVTVAAGLGGFLSFAATGEEVAAEGTPLGEIPFKMLTAKKDTNELAIFSGLNRHILQKLRQPVKKINVLIRFIAIDIWLKLVFTYL